MEVIPAVDIRGGRCVRLVRGEFDRETVYDHDPVARARAFVAAGARRLHVVDLDGARSGEPENLEPIRSICDAVEAEVQAGGGVRSLDAARRLLDAGVGRLVVGSAVAGEPELLERLVDLAPGRVVASLDARGRELAVHGWTEGAGADVLDVAQRLAGTGVAAVVVTQIERDGTLAGPDLALVEAVLGACPVDVLASGGVASLDDVRALAGLEVEGRRVAGAVVGRALYEQQFRLEEAIEACSPSA